MAPGWSSIEINIHESRVNIHEPRLSMKALRVSMQGSRVSLHGPRMSLHGPRMSLHSPRMSLQFRLFSRNCCHFRIVYEIKKIIRNIRNFEDTKFRKHPSCMAAGQYLGAFCAPLVLWGVYSDAIFLAEPTGVYSNITAVSPNVEDRMFISRRLRTNWIRLRLPVRYVDIYRDMSWRIFPAVISWISDPESRMYILAAR